jgi:hypothetical protein
MLVISTRAAFQTAQIGTNAVRLCVEQEVVAHDSDFLSSGLR